MADTPQPPEPQASRISSASTIAPRPSAEQLERPDQVEVARTRAAGRAHDALRVASLTPALFLRKFCELSLMAAFLGSVFAYQLQVKEEWLKPLFRFASGLYGTRENPGQFQWLGSLLGDFLPLLNASMPVLEFKTLVWLSIGLMLIFGHLTAKLYERATGAVVFPTDQRERLTGPRRWLRIVPLACIGLFLGWSLLSFLDIGGGIGWAPVPVKEALNADLASRHAGQFQAWVSWIQLAVALVFFIVAEDLFRTRHFAYKVLAVIAVSGLAAAIISIVTHMQPPGLRSIWVKMETTDYRNDVGGVLGHNTAISAFLIAPILLGWVALVAPHRRHPVLARVLLLAALMTMGLAVLLAQSRAVIPILVVAFAAMLLLLARRAAIRPGMRVLAAVPLAVALLVMTQLVASEHNPFYRRNLPLAERVSQMSFTRLKTETRLRILICSLPLVGEHPLRGTGWSSFHYVYPAAQAAFYEANPDSDILPWDRVTFRAHNEYLQTMVETGAVGVLVALIALFALWRAGWDALRTTFHQRHIAAQIAVGVSIAAMLTHAGADFPLRVAPLACTLLLLLAIWSAGDRVWLIAVPGLDARASGAADEPDGGAETPQAAPAPLRWGAVGVLVAVFFLALLHVRVMALGGNWISAKILSMTATAKVEGFRTAPEAERPRKEFYLDEAGGDYAVAMKLSPLDADPLFGSATLHDFEVRLLQESARRYHAAGDIDAASRYMKFSEQKARQGLEFLDRALAERRHYGMYRQRATLNYQLASALNDREYRRRAFEDLNEAIRLNPGAPSNMTLLIGWLEAEPGIDSAGEVARLRRMMRHFHPGYFAETEVGGVAALREIGEAEAAYQAARKILAVDARDVAYIELAGQAAFDAGRLAEARRLARELAPGNPVSAQMLEAMIAAREGVHSRALALLRGLAIPRDAAADEKAIDWRPYARLLSAMLEARAAESPQARTAAEQTLSRLASADYGSRFATARMYLDVLRAPSAAEEWIRKRLEMAEQPAGIADHALLARVLMTRADADVRRLRDALAGGLPLPEIAPATRVRLEEARTALARARALTSKAAQKSALDRRLAELDRMLAPPVAAGDGAP